MTIILDRLAKHYGRQPVVDGVSLSVEEGELFVLPGASGSGKSTILRLIAGLAQPDGGKILLHGRDVTYLPPQARGTGFVFQNYSIFRHMSVATNIEFGLKIRKVARATRAEERDRLLDLVGLAGLGSRYPDQLSGGQRQRVALARALAYKPSVLLLDEPFGALDVKIRSQLRKSLKEIQKTLGVTTILVTHDQEEAFEVGDRMGVLDRGKLLEVGKGEDLYRSPRTLFTATFLGAGSVLAGRAEKGLARMGPLALPIPDQTPHEEGAPVRVLFRPEQVTLSDEEPKDAPVLGKGKIIESSFAGSVWRVRVRLPRLAGTRQLAPPVPFGEEDLQLEAVLPADQAPRAPEAWVSLRGWHVLKQPQTRLLVCDAGEGSNAPLATARLLIRSLRASVTVLGVAEDQEEGENLVDALKQRQKEADLPDAPSIIRFGDAVRGILGEQNEALYDLTLIAANDGHDRRRDRLGQTVRGVLERTASPVLVVKKEPAGFARILICTAAGEPGKSDVLHGGRLAHQLGAAVTLLHVKSSPNVNPLAAAHLSRAAATLVALDLEAEVRIRSARKPSQAILLEAREGNYDLIVVGSHGPQARSAFSLDDITLQIIAGSNRAVMVVPAEEN